VAVVVAMPHDYPMGPVKWDGRSLVLGHAATVAGVALCTAVDWALLRRLDSSNLVMTYLLVVVLAAFYFGRGPAAVGAVLGVLAFDFFFVPPYLNFAVADSQYLLTFAVMLLVGLVISGLAASVRRQARLAAEARLRVETERLRNSLLAAISHDLRTPLAAIIGASSSLAEEEARFDPAARRALGRDILDASRRMHELMNKVLEMARLQSGKIELKVEWYPLEELIGSVLGYLKERLEDHPVVVELPPQAPWILADGSLIEQVLANLVENAVKYTPPGTRITIGARREGDALTVEVADQGPGLPVGTEERVFEKFYQAQPESAGGGVGLGLTICRTIVEAHGGSIRAASRAGGGASFVFDLPVKGEPPAVVGERDE
jgi:two-component system, OmpR family, sensor histidine kinase KdpD